MPDAEHLRHILLYHFQKGWEAEQSFRDLNDLFGGETITKSQCEQWFARFKSGDLSLKDKSESSQPAVEESLPLAEQEEPMSEEDQKGWDETARKLRAGFIAALGLSKMRPVNAGEILIYSRAMYGRNGFGKYTPASWMKFLYKYPNYFQRSSRVAAAWELGTEPMTEEEQAEYQRILTTREIKRYSRVKKQ